MRGALGDAGLPVGGPRVVDAQAAWLPASCAHCAQDAFTSSCHASCQQVRDAAFCTRYCGCMLGRLDDGDMLVRLDKGDVDPALKARIADLASTCTVETDDAVEGATEGEAQ